MNQQKVETTLQTNLQGLSKLESELASIISPAILDYAYILTPKTAPQINLNLALNDNQKVVLENYIKKSSEVLKQFGVEIDISKKSVFEQFILFSRHIYLLRFMEARRLFAAYSLYRVPTPEERAFGKQIDENGYEAILLEIEIPNAFVIDNDGLLDLASSIENEQETSIIRSTLSSYTILFDVVENIFTDLFNINETQIFMTIHKDLLMKMFEDILQLLIVEANKETYNYLAKGYQPIEAVETVKSYISKITNTEGTKLPEIFSKVEDNILEIINLAFSEIKIDKKVRDDTTRDILHLVLNYCRRGKIVSDNLFKIEYIPHNELSELESEYHNLINVYILDNFGGILSKPSESYDINFSQNFKKDLFELVTNGVVNPNLTLDDYLQS